jgi:hypothetical protein
MSENVVDLSDHRIILAIEAQSPYNRENSNIVEALQEAKGRAVLYEMMNRCREKELQEKHNIDPKMCRNEVCEHCESGVCDCEHGRPVGCIYRMVDHPPNSLDYEDYMPSHREALDRLEAKGLLKGERQRYLEECAKYGRPTSSSERGQYVINGVTMDQFRQALLNCMKELMGQNFSFDEEGDQNIVANNVTIEMEKVLGIYPNICTLR